MQSLPNFEHNRTMQRAGNRDSNLLDYPEVILNAGPATLGKMQRKKLSKEKRTAQREEICRLVCALLNSGGGIVAVKSDEEDFYYTELEDIEEALTQLIGNLIAQEYYDYMPIKSHFLIFVKTWNTDYYGEVCTLGTELYVRSSSRNQKASSKQVLLLVEKKTKGAGKRSRCSTSTTFELQQVQKLLDKPFLCLGEKLGLSETQFVEFKDYSTEKSIQRIKENLKAYLSAFGNYDGGYLIIGVDDNSKVKGCFKDHSESELQRDLERLIDHEISKMKFVHFKGCDCVGMEIPANAYTLYLKQVKDEDDSQKRYIIILKIEPFCCLGFVDDPQSWVLDSVSGKEKRLTAEEWINKITSNCIEPPLESQFQSLSLTTPLGKKVYTKNSMETLETLQSNLFGSLEDILTIKPDDVYSELKAEYPELNGLLENVVPNAKGVMLLSRSWAVDLELNRNQNVICEVLVLIPGEHPKLYSVVEDSLSEEDFAYSSQTALAVKQLVTIGGYTGKLCIIPALLQLHTRKEYPPSLNAKYPETYKLEDLGKLLQSLTKVMLHFTSFLSDKIGIEFFNLLTTEQYEVMSKSLKNFGNVPVFIHGPPGTGKTVLALKIISRLKNTSNCSSDDILYICENTPLRAYVRSKGICLAETRHTFIKENFSNIKHIVADEAQNFQIEEGNWFVKATSITEKYGGTGAFYVFLDDFQSCHTKDTGLPPYSRQNKYILKQVVRNPEEIYKTIKPSMEKIAHWSPFLREIVEESECCHGVPGKFIRHKPMSECNIVKDVANACIKYICEGYSQGDIAILCSTLPEVERYNPLLEAEIKSQSKKRRKFIKPFELAEKVMDEVMILDSVRRFSGLERAIIFAIDPKCQDPRVDINVFLCAASRATAKLHVFLKEECSMAL